MWMDELKSLNDRDRESFSRLVNLLLARTFLIRERVDPRDKSLAIDRDFRFLERYHSLLRGYLDVAGWDLKLDSLAVMDFVMALENRFDLVIPMDELTEVVSVGDLARLLLGHLKTQSAG